MCISSYNIKTFVLFINFVPKDIIHVIILPYGTEALLSDLVIPHSSGINVFTKKSKCQKTINRMLMHVCFNAQKLLTFCSGVISEEK